MKGEWEQVGERRCRQEYSRCKGPAFARMVPSKNFV